MMNNDKHQTCIAFLENMKNCIVFGNRIMMHDKDLRSHTVQQRTNNAPMTNELKQMEV